jgi:hypothetical protein
MKKMFYVLLLGCINTNCSYLVRPNCHKKIYIRNNSDKEIFYVDESLEQLRCPPYSFSQKPYSIDSTRYEQTKFSDNCYEEDFRNGSFKLTLTFFKDDPKALRGLDCDVNKIKSLVLEERVITLEYLQKNNWTITYPK